MREEETYMGQRKYQFEKLTPTNDMNLDVYEDAVNYVFENPDIKNVAISGAYSAGKSSVLASYKKKHSNLLFLHISLAHFKSLESKKESEVKDSIKGKKTNDTKENTEVKESVLEGKILNQLIHQISSDKIPQTNFRVKKEVCYKTVASTTAVIVLFLITVFYFIYFDAWKKYVVMLPSNWFKSFLMPFTHQYALLLDSGFIIGLLSIIIYKLIYIQKNKNIFRKLNLQGNEIEIFEESDDSYFDKYLNEVLYLFENSDADVVVFEDMDRFNASKIFERLHEVNTLANIQLEKENKKVLRFFYLLRDDIFITKDRTKFFDYIIPVVPVVDSSNSYDQFISHFKNTGLFEKFDENFLQGLSLYIDDMRLLKNIYNEFVIYYNRLNTTELDCNKMLAMIAYKNLFPRDFADLQLNQGFIHTLFEKKDKFIADEINKIDKYIFDINNQIKLVKDNHIKSKEELAIIYARKHLNNYRWYSESLSRLQSFVIDYLPGNIREEYNQRLEQVENLLNINLTEKEKILHNYEIERVTIKNKSLHEIITRDNIDSIFSVTSINEIGELTDFNDIKSSEYFDLLKYLIRYGYIDETYSDYMTYFYENSLSRIDKTFLRSITDKKSKEPSYQLKNPQLVISRLRVVDFEQEETLNYDLLEYLLLNSKEYFKYLEALLKQIKESRNFEFVSKFFDTNKAHSQFVIELNKQWNNLFSSMIQESTIPSTQIRQYSIDTLCYCNNDTITKVNIDDCLTKYISESPDYINIKNPNIDKLISAFLHIGVSFISIDYEKSDINLLNEVYKNNLYVLNFDNISIMLKHENMIENHSDIIHKNYTVIQSQEDYPLKKYILDNMPIYIEIILNNCDGCISDDESSAISLLNSDKIDIDKKKGYVKFLSTIINNITEVLNTELWPIIMKKRILSFSTANFMNYFIKFGLDDILVHYINEMPSDIDFSSTNKIYGKEISVNLFDAVVVCNDILTEKYKKILIDLKYYFDNFDADDITEEKIEVLISAKIIQMKEDSLKFIRENYETQLDTFIRDNFEDYLDIQSNEIAKVDEITKIITWYIDNDKKIKLLSYLNNSISIVGKQYDDAINAYIIAHNLYDEDKNHLYSHYRQYGEKTQEAILLLSSEEISEIINDEIQVDDLLLSALLKTEVVTYEQKVELFNIAIPVLNEDTCKIHLDELGLPELKMIFEKASGRRNYQKNVYVTSVLEALKLNHWIYEYHVDERNSNKYVIIKNKPRSFNKHSS